VIRGGSWNNNDDNCRVANRNNNNPDNSNNNLGFRLSRSSKQDGCLFEQINILFLISRDEEEKTDFRLVGNISNIGSFPKLVLNSTGVLG